MKFSPCKLFKYVYSSCLLLFCAAIVISLILSEQTRASQAITPGFTLLGLVLLLLWLNMVEGGQAALIGLAPIDPALYAESHPRTHMSTALAYRGDNLERYLLGRQFMVLLIVFATNVCCATSSDAHVAGLSHWIIELFLGSDLAVILLTAMAGQLNSQVNASSGMLDYINNYFSLFTLYFALAIEFSGLLHVCYLFRMVAFWAAGKSITTSGEPPRTLVQNFFYWGRVAFSLAILVYSTVITIGALFQGKTEMWEGVSNGVAIFLFVFFMTVVGQLEAAQIAFFAVAKLSESERDMNHPISKMTCDLLFQGKGRNLPRFMIGRQMCVTGCFFVIARVTTMSIEVGNGENLFGVSDELQLFFNTGLLGALVTTVIASISWQLVASAFPFFFLRLPTTYIFLRFCLFLESTGICSGAWVIAAIHKKLAGFHRDEYYIGPPKERIPVLHTPPSLLDSPVHPEKISGYYQDELEMDVTPFFCEGRRSPSYTIEDGISPSTGLMQGDDGRVNTGPSRLA